MFECLKWADDFMTLRDWRFVLEAHGRPRVESALENNFGLFKSRQLYEQYEQVFAAYPNFKSDNIIELGVWDGGSLVVWNEVFHPAKLVGIDVRTDRADNKYLRAYLERPETENRIKIYWGVNQADRGIVAEICEREFSAPLDLIIDDASHYYEESKSSFEMLFPRLRQGGLYIIEDWAWSYWSEYDEHPYFDGRTGLAKLIVEIAEMIGSARGVSPATITIHPGLAVVQKGILNTPGDQPFYLEKQIRRKSDEGLPLPPPAVRKLG